MMAQLNEQMAQPEVFENKQTTENFKDDRIYKISKDKEGGGSVLIRFLPSQGNEGKMQTFITKKIHSINNQRIVGDKTQKVWTGNLICPTQHKEKCPICDYGWSGFDKESKTWVDKSTQKFTADEKYLSNIMIIDDTINPENNGKVMVLEYGKQVANIIKKEMHPTEDEVKYKDKKGFNAWNVLDSRNFLLKLIPGKKTANGRPSWEESFFVPDSSLLDTDKDKIETILSSTFNLDDFVKADLILSKEELQDKLDTVLFRKSSEKPKADMPEVQKEEPKVEAKTEPKVEVKEEVEKPAVKAEEKEEPKKEETATVDMDAFFSQFK